MKRQETKTLKKTALLILLGLVLTLLLSVGRPGLRQTKAAEEPEDKQLKIEVISDKEVMESPDEEVPLAVMTDLGDEGRNRHIALCMGAALLLIGYAGYSLRCKTRLSVLQKEAADEELLWMQMKKGGEV